MPIKREARYLSGNDIGKTINLYCRDTRRTGTIEILAIEAWPDEIIIWGAVDEDKQPFHLDRNQQVLISGQKP